MLKLIIEDDEGRKTVVPFVREEITIGRQEGNTIRLTERNVSRRHAKLVRQNGHVLVEDLGSYNGIRINGDRIAGQVKVHDGDLIQIGDYDLAVQREEAANAPPSSTNAATVPLAPLEETSPRGNAAALSATQRVPSMGETIPALPTVGEPSDTGPGDDEAEEANPDDVQAAPSRAAEDAARRQSTAIIRMDQMESNGRDVVDLDPAEAPRLVVLNTEFAGKEFACIRTELKLGRTDDNDIAIDHRSLSRTHCKVVRENTGEWRVIDMQSANGLMVNGEPYAQSALKSGDVLELGHVKLKFVGPGEAFAVSASAEGVTVRQGKSKLPLILGGVGGVLVLAGVAWYLLRPNPPPPPAPAPVAVKEPAAVKEPEVAPPAVVEPPAPDDNGKANERRIAEARAKIAALDFKAAEDLLNQCKVGDSPLPEATRLLTAMKNERDQRKALLAAEAAIGKGDAAAALRYLKDAESTELLQDRYGELKKRADELSTVEVLVKPPTEPVKPPPEPVKPPPEVAVKPEPVRPAVPARPQESEADLEAKAAQLCKEALDLTKSDRLRPAKLKIDECMKIAPTNVRCLLNSGGIYQRLGAKENDAALTAKAKGFYQAFVKAACPGHKSCEQIQGAIKGL